MTAKRSAVAGLLAGAVAVGGCAALAWPEPPVREVTSAPEPTPSREAIELTDLPCEQGMWAVRFSSTLVDAGDGLGMTWQELVGTDIAQLDARRAFLGVDPVDFAATGPGNDVCSGLYERDTDSLQRLYIYAGPMLLDAALALCASLKFVSDGKPVRDRCMLVKLTATTRTDGKAQPSMSVDLSG